MKKEIFNHYVNAVAKRFDITQEEMFAKTKKRESVDARQLLYYLCISRPMRVSYVEKFLQEIGFPASRSAIIHGSNVVKKMIEEDTDYHHIVKSCQPVM